MGLPEIQQKLHAPKKQFNSFGKYNYRACEDILEAVKPLLGNATLTLSDSVEDVGGRIYVKATATYRDGEDVVSVTAFAREAENKKGMDDSQITGTASSYARKYALNGLFCIDDTKDADTQPPQDNEKQQSERDELLAWMKDCAKHKTKIYKSEIAKAGKKSATEMTLEELRNFKDTINAVINQAEMNAATHENNNG